MQAPIRNNDQTRSQDSSFPSGRSKNLARFCVACATIRTMTVITFLGAGSVVFTRELLADILAFDELREVTLALHDIDAERLETAEAIARRTAEQLGAAPKIITSLDRRAALDGRRLRHQRHPGGHARRDGARLRRSRPGTGCARRSATRSASAGSSARCAPSPCSAGIAADMRAVCPDAWLLNYTNPMAMNVAYLAAIAPDLKVVGLCHSVFWTVHDLCELIGVPLEEVDYRAAGRQPPGVAAALGAPRREPLPAAGRAHRRGPAAAPPGAVDMYRAARATTRPRPASTPPSTCRGTCTTTARSSGCASRSATTCASARRTSPSTPPPARAVLAGEPLDLHRDATEYAPQVIHSMVTGTVRRIHANVANHGLISNLPEGFAVEVPCVVDRLGVRPERVGALPPQCAALNRGSSASAS